MKITSLILFSGLLNYFAKATLEEQILHEHVPKVEDQIDDNSAGVNDSNDIQPDSTLGDDSEFNPDLDDGTAADEAYMKKMEEEFRKDFAKYDINQDGFIDSSELMKHFPESTEYDIIEFLEEVDANGDNLVDLEEFLDAGMEIAEAERSLDYDNIPEYSSDEYDEIVLDEL